MEPHDIDIKMEDFVDVVYKCKFCPYTCTQSPDMGLHVRENHLRPPSASNHQTQLISGISKTGIKIIFFNVILYLIQSCTYEESILCVAHLPLCECLIRKINYQFLY